MTYRYSQMILFQIMILVLFIFPNKINAQTSCSLVNGSLIVSNTLDDGPGSLRNAITCANAIPGPNEIFFNISGAGPHEIFVGSTTGMPLPNVSDTATIIDGSTQPGFIDEPLIILDGSQTNWTGPYNAIFILANDCEIYGLTIRNFPDDAIDVYASDNVTIGAPNKGNVIYDNGYVQDIFPNFPGSWEGCGLVIRNGSDNCTIQGNRIGTNYNQTLNGGNEFCGIIIRGFCLDATIGGTQTNEENVIANNAEAIRIDNSYDCSIRRNQVYCNDTIAIGYTNNGNYGKTPPTILTVETDEISGLAPTGDIVDVYLVDDANCPTAPCQGKIFLGSTNVSQGAWSITSPFANGTTIQGGMKVTAIGTSLSNGASSFYANCRTVQNTGICAEPNGDIWVTNTDDEGLGSLRAAIDCANGNFGPNQIKFNIPGTGPHRIYVGSMTGMELPPLLDVSTLLDGTTQSGFGASGNYSPQIILDGSQNNWIQPINALWVRADFCEVYGLEVVNFPDDGIDVTAANNVIIGAPNKGNVIYNNGYELDSFPGLPNTGPWNGCGIVIRTSSSFVTVQGNIIGTDYTQTDTSGNEYCGILIRNSSNDNQIGGSGVGEANLITNNEFGVGIGGGALRCRIQQNSIYCNSIGGIGLGGNGNNFLLAPTITDATLNNVSGQAGPKDNVEVFISDACPDFLCQGRLFLGVAQADTSGNWSLTSPFFNNINLVGNENISATATDTVNNTSRFSSCFVVPGCDSLIATATSITNSICGLNNGSFSINVSNGIAPYVYNIGNGNQTDNTFNNLSEGIYNITITDANGCSTFVEVTIDDTPSFTTNIQSLSNENCNLGDGSFTLGISGGLVPFTFDIGNGPTTNGTFSGLSAGTYSATITDANNCVVTQEAVIENVSIIINVDASQNATCGLPNGSFTVSTTNGLAPFTYDIGNGNTSNNTFTSLSSGTYAVMVTDANGCTDSQNIVITDTDVPTMSINNVVDALCGQSNGSFTIIPSGGTSPYTYNDGSGSTSNPQFNNLEAGTYTVTVTDANACTVSQLVEVSEINITANIVTLGNTSCGLTNGNVTLEALTGTSPFTYDIGNGSTSNNAFTSLESGTYIATISDANNCTTTQSFTIAGSTAPTFSFSNVNNANCGQSDGSFTVNPSGGVAPYLYDDGNGSTSNPIFTGLTAGNYNITVTDALGCTDSQIIMITSSTSATVSIENISNEICGQMNAAFSANVTGGVAPFSYDIGNGSTSNNAFTNLSSGTYVVTITDANNCTATESVSIFGVAGPEIVSGDVIPSVCGQPNGAISITVTNGTSPFTYDIGNGPTPNNVITNLLAGEYTVTVTDANQCTDITTVTVDGMGSVPEAGFLFVDDGLIVSFSNTSSTADSYFWDFGDGDTSSLISPTHIYNSTGTYTVCLTITNDCGSDTFCETITLLGADALIIDVGELVGVEGDTVHIPVTVEDFEDIVLFQKSIHLTDPSVASFVGTSNFNLVDLTNSSFNISDETVTVMWLDLSGTGQTVADGTVLYTLDLVLKNNISCSSIVIDGTPTPIQVVKKINGNDVMIGTQLIDGEVCVIQGTMNFPVDILGEIAKENNQTVANVEVNCTNTSSMMTATDGLYSFLDLPHSTTYTVTPSKLDNPINGVSGLDMVKIQQHILGTIPMDSPYKIIAADVNNSGGVTTLDLAAIQSLILGNSTQFPNNTSWRFVPAAYEFIDSMNPLNENFPEEITLNNLTVDALSQDFVAIKIGDINLNSVPSLTSSNSETLSFIISNKNLSIHSVETNDDDFVELEFKAKDYKQISAWQMDLSFDKKELEFLEIGESALPNFNISNTGNRFLENGILPILWLNPSGEKEGLTLEDETVLFTLKFKLKKGKPFQSDWINILTERMQKAAFGKNKTLKVNVLFENKSLEEKQKSEIQIISNSPNPFRDFVTINFFLSKKEKIELSVFDGFGRIIFVQELKTYEQGENKIELNRNLFPSSGVYYYRLMATQNQVQGKLIHTK